MSPLNARCTRAPKAPACQRSIAKNLFDTALQKMSTLLSDLDSAPPLADGDFVQNILSEMNGGGAPPPRQAGTIDSPSSNTAMAPRVMDSAPATAHVIGNSHPTPADFANMVQAANSDGSSAAAFNTPAPPPSRPTPAKKSWTSRILDEFKLPLFVTVIVFVFSLPVVNFLFAHYIPSMVKATGQLTTIGLLVKSAAAGATFWVLQRVIVPLLSR